MALINTKLGKHIKQSDARNSENKYGEDSVVGLSTQKQMIVTKADLAGVNLANYKLFAPGQFAYVPDTSRRGDKMSMAYNSTDETYLVSSISIVFYVSDTNSLSSDYLFMYFNRPEFDRYSRFNSWGSARETFNWEDMCDTEIELPPLDIQQKYVAVHNTMLANQKNYECGLDDLRLVCEGYLDKLKATLPLKRIGDYIELSEEKNFEAKYGLENVRGVSIDKRFIETKADMKGVNLTPYYIVHPDDFVYVTVTSRNSEKISLAYNESSDTYICSSSYVVFRCKDRKMLLPRYLRIYFERSEFNRYARFNSWGSARETFDYSDMEEVCIPIPSIQIQQSISEIFDSYTTRRYINERLKAQIKAICPILIKGAMEEAST